MKKPSVLVIVITHNGIEDTRMCLSSLAKTNYDNFRVVVVDNGSVRNEARLLEKEFGGDTFSFKRLDRNYGYAYANNIVAESAREKYIAYLNNDTEVTKEWLIALVECAEADRKIAGVQSKLRSFYNKKYFDPSACGGYLDKLGYPYTRGRIGVHLEKDEGQYDDVVDIIWGASAALLVRRKVLEKIGMLPVEFFAYHEETDLCWRMNNFGYRVVSCPQSLVYHKSGAWWRKHSNKKAYLIHRNSLMMIVRNSSFKKILWALPLRLILDVVNGLYYLLIGKPGFLVALIRADLDFALGFPKLIIKRIKNYKMPVEAENKLTPFSVYWDYYVFKKRRFSEIRGEVSDTGVGLYDKVLKIDEGRD